MNNQIELIRNMPNILVVDDVPANLKLLDNILKPEGYKTRLVTNGEMALRAAEKEKPDLILLDIMMPGMDGFEICGRLKENPGMKDIPIIFISAMGETANIVKALALGGVDYIHKPFHAEEVLARVKTHLRLRRQSEELKIFSKAVEQSPVSIFITNLDGTIEYVNPKSCEISGYTKAELIGQNPGILKSEVMPDAGYDQLWKTISTGKTWNGVFQNKKKNGELYWESAIISPITGENGEIIHYLAVQEDITERRSAIKKIQDLNASLEQKVKDRTRELYDVNKHLENNILELKKAEEEIIKSRDEAMKANLAKSEFLSRVSHELRTPMNAILGFSQLLDMGELIPMQKRGVKHILKSGRHLLDLINEVLDISRVEAGKFPISIEPVQVLGVLMEVIDTLRPLADQQHVTIELVCSPNQDLFIMADKQRTKKTLINLLDNAIKYNHEGGYVKIETTIAHENDKGIKAFRISVTDTGQGISASDLPKIFNPFERIDAEKSGIEGTGLGLSVVSKLMEAMKGSMGLESTPGQGSTFWIEFPMYEGDFNAAENQMQPMNPSQPLIQKSGVILYIEDNVPNIELIGQILAGHYQGIKLISTSYGNQAVLKAEEFRPDLILLDLDLPDIHGAEIFRMLQENEITKNIPVVVISAEDMPRQLELLKKTGVKEYLPKPLDVPSFLKIVDKWVKV